jgi:hypothetical protein
MSDPTPDPTPIVKYLVNGAHGEFVIELPATWKVTFGAVNPGSGQGGGFDRSLHCLRVWETKDKLRAVFCDVRGIRDLSIPLARKVQRETGSAEWAMDSEGNFERSQRRAIEAQWAEDAIPFDGGLTP